MPATRRSSSSRSRRTWSRSRSCGAGRFPARSSTSRAIRNGRASRAHAWTASGAAPRCRTCRTPSSPASTAGPATRARRSSMGRPRSWAWCTAARAATSPPRPTRSRGSSITCSAGAWWKPRAPRARESCLTRSARREFRDTRRRAPPARRSRATAVARRRRSVARTGSQAAELGVEGFTRDAETARGGALRGLLLEALADERELDPREDAGERLARHDRLGVADAGGQVMAADALPQADGEHQAMHLVGELAHVARPGVGLERPQRGAVEAAHRAALALLAAGEEVRRERRHVGHAVPERWHANGEYGEAVVEVEAEAPRRHLGLERAVGGRDDARAHAARAVGAHRLHLLVLEDAEQLRLHGRRRLADLVEENGALPRLLEEPVAVTLGAGEGPAHVAEELALEERLGEGGAVLHQERRLRARAAAVDGARQELLASTGLAFEEDGHGAQRGALDERQDRAHVLGGGDEGRRVRAGERRHAAVEARLVDGGEHRAAERLAHQER